MKTTAEKTLFGQLPDGSPVERVVLTHDSGIEVAVISYGAAVQSLSVPDRHGGFANVVLGHGDLRPYLDQRNYFGATVGRYANRIAHGRFVLGGKSFDLATNDGPNALHGGLVGFDRRNWTLEDFGTDPEPFAVFSLHSPDGDQGYPGDLDVLLRYSLGADRSLLIAIEARGSQDTLVNLTHHGFFNLGGAGAGDILGHELMIRSETYLPVDATHIPLGRPESVAGTPFDFRESVPVSARLQTPNEQLRIGAGFDHNFCLGDNPTGSLQLAARLFDPQSGRRMTLETDQPGLQFYAGGYLGNTLPIEGDSVPPRHGALCLEPQAWPDSPNKPGFPSAVLAAGEVYRHQTVLRFDCL